MSESSLVSVRFTELGLTAGLVFALTGFDVQQKISVACSVVFCCLACFLKNFVLNFISCRESC